MSASTDMSTDVLNKVNELATIIHEHQNTSENYHEKLDRLSTKSADLLEEIGSIKSQNDKQNEVIKSLELQLSRTPNGSINKSNKGCPQDYYIAMDKALRPALGAYRTSLDSNILKEVQEWALNDAKITPYFADSSLKERITKDVIEGVNPQGGYWIIPEYSAEDVTREFETSPMREICNVATTDSNILRWIIDDNLSESGGWVGEVESRSETETARIGELDIPIHEQYAQPRVSHWMLDDAMFDLVGWVSNKSRQTMTLQENAAFLTGNGSKRPRGILDYPSWGGTPVVFGDDSNYEMGALETIYSGASGNFTYDGLVNTQLSLLEAYQPRAIWLTTRQGWAQILQLKDNQDRPLFQLQDLLRTGAQAVLLGKPVRIAAPSTAPTDPTIPVTGGGMPVPGADAKAMIYGDFNKGYTIVDRVGFFTIVDMVTDKQWVKYYVRKRVGGALTSYQSLKVVQQTAVPGPLVNIDVAPTKEVVKKEVKSSVKKGDK